MPWSGVMLCIKQSGDVEVESVEYISDRIIFADVSVHEVLIRFFSVYAPRNGCDDAAKDKFWYKLSAQVNKIPFVYIYGFYA